MDDAALVRGFDCGRDLPSDLERLGRRERTARESLGERLALDVLEGEEDGRAVFFERVDARDVRMPELREDPRLALEARQAFAAGGEIGGQHHDRDRPIETRVAREIDDAHPATSDLALDRVGTEARGRVGSGR